MSKIIIITLILAMGVLFCFLYILGFFERVDVYTFELGWLRGGKTKEEIVAKYIEGLKTGNIQTIEKLVPKTHEADKVIREKIEKFKEADFSEIEIYYGKKPSTFTVEIKNIRLKSGEVISDEISTEKDCHQYPGIKCKKWYLVIGSIKEKFRPISPGMELERN